MKISKYLPTERIFLGVKLSDKDAILHFIAEESCRMGIVDDAKLLYQTLVQREESMSTGLGQGLAFPHATAKVREGISVFLIRLEQRVEFDAVDSNPVDIVVAIISPEDDPSKHLQVLARASRLCQKREFTDIVRRIDDPAALWIELERLEKSLFEYWYET